MKKQIGIIGTGSLGTALIYLLSQNNHQINIYDKNKQILNKCLNNPKIKKQKNVFPTNTILETINNSEYLIPCLPSQAIDYFYDILKTNYCNQIIMSVSKGFYCNSQQTISQKVSPWLKSKNFVVFSGPTFSNEILNDEPTSAIFATSNQTISKLIFNIFKSKNFTPKLDSHVVETEFGGIMKNCYAITFGLLEHAHLGMNTKSLLLDKIISETKEFYKNTGLQWQQAYQMSFLGDLIATSYNTDSRNFQFGKQLRHNKKVTVEGEQNILPLLQIAKQTKTKLPILENTHQTISNPLSFRYQILKLKQILLA